METKICTSMYWKKQTRFLLGICFFIGFAVIVFSLIYKDLEMFVVLGGCSLVCILCIFYLIYCMRRLLTEVLISEAFFQSVILNKNLAVVDKDQIVYYAIFEEFEHAHPPTKVKFILISNSPFKYEPRKSVFTKGILGRYDLHTQILIPYNSDTMKFFDLENWLCVS